MALFDDFAALQDGSQADLIAHLQQLANVQSQYSPSAGFPALPMDANAAMPPQQPQATPIGIGNYQMPRIGDAAGFTLPPGQLNPDTGEHIQPAQATAPAAPTNAWSDFMNRGADALQSVARGGSLLGAIRGSQQPQSGGDHLLAGMSNFAHGGALLPAVANGITGLATGQYDDPESRQKQALQQQYQALNAAFVSHGLSEKEAASQALISVLNPEAAKTIIPQVLSNKTKFTDIGTNEFGKKTYGFVDENNQTVNGKPLSQQPSSSTGGGDQSGFDAIAAARDNGATPDDLYKMVPGNFRYGVQAMIEGRQIPSNLSRGDARNTAIALAHTIDPTFDESQIPTRVAGNKNFYGGGSSSETMRKANQSALHFGELVDKMPTLPGTSIPAVNAAGNFINSELLGKDAEGNFVTNGHALADELSSLFKGSGISDTEIRAWESNLSPNMSDQQQRGMAKTLLGIYRDSVTALDKKRVEAVGPVVAANKGPILGPEAEASLQRVEKFANGGATKTVATSALPDKSAVEAEMKRRGLLK